MCVDGVVQKHSLYQQILSVATAEALVYDIGGEGLKGITWGWK